MSATNATPVIHEASFVPRTEHGPPVPCHWRIRCSCGVAVESDAEVGAVAAALAEFARHAESVVIGDA
ncbi:MAG: hypothetical protein ACYCV7_14090 [Acidimicrobiales bacterium]